MNTIIAIGYANKGGNMEKWRESVRRNVAFLKKLPYSIQLRIPYVLIIEHFFREGRDPEAAWEWAKAFETRAGQHNDFGGVATAWLYQGWVLSLKGDDKGVLSVQKGLELFKRIGDEGYANNCHWVIGTTFFNFGKVEEAKSHMSAFLRLAVQIQHR